MSGTSGAVAHGRRGSATAVTDRPSHSREPGSTGRRIGVRAALVVIAVVLLARFAKTGSDEILRALEAVGGGEFLLLGAVLVLEIGWVLSLARLLRSSVAAVGGTVPALGAIRISMGAFTASRVVPGGGAGGGIFAARELTLLGNQAPTALAGLIVSWVVATTALAALTLAAASGAAAVGGFPLVYLVPPTVALIVVAGGALLTARALRSSRLRHRLVDLASRLLRRVHVDIVAVRWEASLDQVVSHLRERRHLLRAGGWAVVAWSLDAAALWVVFHTFGHELSLAQVVVGYTAANLVNSLPELIPGWIGVFEAALTTTFVALGVPLGIAVVAVLVYRLASFWLPVAAGVLPALATFGARPARADPVPVIDTEHTP